MTIYTFFVNDNISKYCKLFITTLINCQKNKYSYGKQFRQKNANFSKILLPLSPNNPKIPDWDFMEQYAKVIAEKKVNAYKQYATTILSGLEYKETSLVKQERERLA